MFNIRYQEQAIVTTQRRLADERAAFSKRTDQDRADIKDTLRHRAILWTLKKGLSIDRARLSSTPNQSIPKKLNLERVRKTITIASVGFIAWQLLSNRERQ